MGATIDITPYAGKTTVSVRQVSHVPEIYIHVDDVDKKREEQRRYYRCNVCGDVFKWDEDSVWIEHSVDHGYKGYEVGFIVCSVYCRKFAREKYITWISSYPGWTKKSAGTWYDKNCKDWDDVPVSAEEIVNWKIRNRDTEVQRAYFHAEDDIQKLEKLIESSKKSIVHYEQEIEKARKIMQECIDVAVKRGYGTEIFNK